MFCDVEKYLDDSKEEMSKYGMGVLYTKDSNGKVFAKRNNKEDIINNYYIKHHEELDNMVEKILNRKGDCFIIDLHSFSDEFVKKVLNKDNCPDICIGINNDNYDINLIEKTINHFTKYGYSVMINYPYSGSIISNRFPYVKSIMIEINKRVYLSSQKEYNDFYNCMMKYYELLKSM
jgi:N-formylglutamate amidohydrolase